MQNFTVFDIVIVSITLLLGLKGLLRGFIKEVFALIGIIGGIFVGTRMAPEIGKEIAPILALENQTTINLIGLIIGLIIFWAVLYVIGIILSRIFSASGLGLFDRILGFIFGATKIFLIFAVIVHLIYQIQSFKTLMNDKVGNSITFPYLITTGSTIAKIDFVNLAKKVEEKVASKEEVIEENPSLDKKESFTKELSNTVSKIKKTTVESSTAVVDTVKKAVNETLETTEENK